MPEMSKFAAYLKERENVELLETDNAFVIYSISGEECYIRDIWVDKPFRKSKIASELADQVCEIAREKGCKTLTGTVVPSANGSTTSLEVLIGYGMTLHSSSNNFIVFTKAL